MGVESHGKSLFCLRGMMVMGGQKFFNCKQFLLGIWQWFPSGTEWVTKPPAGMSAPNLCTFMLFWHPMPPLIQFHIMFLDPAIQKATPVSSFFHSKHYPNWTLIWQVEFYEYSPITSSLSESFPCEYMTALQWLCCYMEKSNTAYIIKVSNLQTLK